MAQFFKMKRRKAHGNVHAVGRIASCLILTASVLAGVRSGLAADAAVAASDAGKASGQSDAEVLLNLFQKKGIISSQDASEARDALAKTHHDDSTSANNSKIHLPSWVESVTLGSDFRGRFEENNAENAAYHARDRFRYRLRIGAVFKLDGDFEIGFRLGSGNPLLNGAGALVGGASQSASADFNSLDSRKFLWVDAAYARWTPVHDETWTVSGTIGKMDNPFSLSNMIWDYDIVPEGAAFQVNYKINADHTIKTTVAGFVLDEMNQSVTGYPTVDVNHDPYVLGGQMALESKWNSKFSTSAGVAVFDVGAKDSLSAQIQPFYNTGNTRDANGFLKYNYNPVIGTLSATYKLDSAPLYPGEFPIKVSGEYLNNPGAPSANTAWRAGINFGKAGRKGAWEIAYRYQRLEADAWFDALADDDNGAFYAKGNSQLAGTPKSNGWFGGTNLKGHLIQGTYSFTDYMNFQFTYYLNELIVNVPGQSSSAGHFMADLNWKF